MARLESDLDPNAATTAGRRHFQIVPILLQKSLRSGRKVNTRNNRTRTNEHLNQHCEPMPDSESKLPTRVPEIFLQQYLPIADSAYLVMAPVAQVTRCRMFPVRTST